MKTCMVPTHPQSGITNNRNLSNCMAFIIVGKPTQFSGLVPRTCRNYMRVVLKQDGGSKARTWSGKENVKIHRQPLSKLAWKGCKRLLAAWRKKIHGRRATLYFLLMDRVQEVRQNINIDRFSRELEVLLQTKEDVIQARTIITFVSFA